jgi:3-oxoacyl-[acyl-carrier protein] reductase
VAEDAAETLRDVAYAELGHVDILVNNAGGSRAPVDAPEERWLEAMTLNFTSPQRQIALPRRR